MPDKMPVTRADMRPELSVEAVCKVRKDGRTILLVVLCALVSDRPDVR